MLNLYFICIIAATTGNVLVISLSVLCSAMVIIVLIALVTRKQWKHKGLHLCVFVGENMCSLWVCVFLVLSIKAYYRSFSQNCSLSPSNNQIALTSKAHPFVVVRDRSWLKRFYSKRKPAYGYLVNFELA